MGDVGSWALPVIITRDSSRWIEPILGHYHAMGLSPRVLLDSRTSDGTAAVLDALGVDYDMVRGDEPRVEALVSSIGHLHPKGWVLRMDDDEVPSAGLLSFLHGPAPSSALAAVALPRWHLWRNDARRITRARWTHPFFREHLEHDWQWRLFQPDRVTYTSEIHTPGFVVPDAERARAPEDAWIAHLVWMVRSLEERRAKVEAYDVQKPGAGSFLGTLYVPEESADLVVLDDEEVTGFETLASELVRSRG